MVKNILLLLLGVAISQLCLSQTPVINSFSPSSGPAGTVITITGTSLSAATSVNIGNIPGILITANATQVTAMVMPGAGNGPVTINTAGGTASGNTNFTISPTPYPDAGYGYYINAAESNSSSFGNALAISADGNTAVIADTEDNNYAGAFWIFKKNSDKWVQQGGKMTCNGAVGIDNVNDVSINADGTTIAIGAPGDNSDAGAVWIFALSGNTWSQQAKIYASSPNKHTYEGLKVAISADGNTVAFSGYADVGEQRAAWIFTRNNSTWSQQGQQVTYVKGPTTQESLAISADAKTLLAGTADEECAQVFVYNGTSWNAQGSVLKPNDASYPASFGFSVALSADGNTAVVGGPSNNGGEGAVWVFVRNGTTWSQQGGRLFSSSAMAQAKQGFNVALSADGNTLLVGSIVNLDQYATIWAYTRSGNVWTNHKQLLPYYAAVYQYQSWVISMSADAMTALGGGETLGVRYFTSNPIPFTTTIQNSTVTATTADLEGSVGDNGLTTTVTMEYGTAPDLTGSKTVPFTLGRSPIAAGTGSVNYTSQLTGLQPATKYYYRINGVNSAGTNHGMILNFTTAFAAPVITSFTPKTAGNGSKVIIKGNNLTGATTVNFGSVAAASFTVDSASTITAFVGTGSSGTVSVITPGGTAVLQGFTYTNSTSPIISSFTPVSASNSQTVTISGINFTGATSVSFGGVAAGSFTVNSSNIITATVGSGSTGNVTITTPNGTGSLTGFTYSASANRIPAITSFTPQIASTGTTITLSGANFNNVTDITIGNTSVSNFIVLSPTTISLQVPNTTSGSISVTTSNGTATLPGFVFVAKPVINNIGPTTFNQGGSVKLYVSKINGYVYQWSKDGTDISGATDTDYTASLSGSYIVKETVGSFTVAATPVVIIVNTIPSPIVTSFNPNIGSSGAQISISGINFNGATSVSFGGLPAKSFIVTSPTSITAVVDTGITGSIKVTTTGGSATIAGFVFIPPLIISASGPTTFTSGGNVKLSSPPGAGFNYQWLKDNLPIQGATSSSYFATESGVYSLLLTAEGNTLSTKAISVNAIFTLPDTNFKISTTSVTCKGQNNGIITINARQSLNYMAVLTGNGINKSITFNTTSTTTGLSPGTYTMCITVANEPSFQQCFDLVITEPQDLSVYMVVNKINSTLTLKLNGGTEYAVQINDKVYHTTSDSLTVPLSIGDSKLVVTTDKICQGIIQNEINLSDNVRPYPNPFTNILLVNLGETASPTITVKIYSTKDGRLLLSKNFDNQSGLIELDMSSFKSGIYSLHLKRDKVESVFKIFKR